jgi:hypothetical protein
VSDPTLVNETLTIRGGGTLPVAAGRVHLTWPFVVLELRDAGISVRVVPGVVRSFGFSFGGVDSPDGGKEQETWSCSWDSLDHALLAPRKVVLCPRTGRRCRFVTLRRRGVMRIGNALGRRGTAIKTISRFSLAGFGD